MFLQAYASIKGAKQGQFKGGSRNPKRKDWVDVLSFEFGLISPRDSATGEATGKRQYQPIRITKKWDPATPQLMQAVVTNEILETVRFEFERIGVDGAEYVYQTVQLTNATVAEIHQYTAGDNDHATKQQRAGDTAELEQVSFVFQKIEVLNVDGQTSFVDDWSA